MWKASTQALMMFFNGTRSGVKQHGTPTFGGPMEYLRPGHLNWISLDFEGYELALPVWEASRQLNLYGALTWNRSRNPPA